MIPCQAPPCHPEGEIRPPSLTKPEKQKGTSHPMKKDQRQRHQAISPVLSLETEDLGREMGPDGLLRCIGSEEP